MGKGSYYWGSLKIPLIKTTPINRLAMIQICTKYASPFFSSKTKGCYFQIKLRSQSQVNDVLNNTGQTLQRFERKPILPLSQRG